MSKRYKIIPLNRNTLFLRNIENILINHRILDETKRKYFRDNTCREILVLIKTYQVDEKNKSNEQTLNRYQFDCMVLRWLDDRKKLSPNFSKKIGGVE